MIKKPKYVLAAGGPLRAPGPIPRKVFLASKSVAVFVLRQGFSEAGFCSRGFRGRVFVEAGCCSRAVCFRGGEFSRPVCFGVGGFLGRGVSGAGVGRGRFLF